MKKTLAILLMTALAPPLPAAIKNPDTFTYLITGDVDSLDPAWQYDGISHEVQIQTYETLISYKGTSTEEMEPLLAASVPTLKNGLLSKDGLTYTFPIRKNVQFHDGTPLTPEDARFSFLRFLLIERSSGPTGLLLEPLLGFETLAGPDGKPLAARFKEVEKAVTIEGSNLVLRLKKPCAPLLSILAAYCPLVSKSFTVKNGGWDGSEGTWVKHYNPAKQATGLYERANGTGPFKIDRWDKENKQVILSRNENYWRAPARLKRVVFKTVNESGTRKLVLQAGDADAAMMERAFLPQVTDLPGVKITDDLPFLEVHNCFIYNFKTNPVANPYIGSGKLDGDGIPPDFFADLNVRKGLASAFDYDAYINDGYRGKGRRARGPIPHGVFGHNPKQPLWQHDLGKAAEYFKKAFGGQVWEKGFHFTISYMDGRADRQLACQILKKTVEQLNPKFKIDVRGIQWSTYLSAFAAGKLPIVNARWGLDFADPHNAVHPFLHSLGNYSKVQGYKNPKADALIEKAWREQDKEKRRAMYHELQAIAHDELPSIYTLDTYNFLVSRSWVKGLNYNPITPYGYLYPVYKEDQ